MLTCLKSDIKPSPYYCFLRYNYGDEELLPPFNDIKQIESFMNELFPQENLIYRVNLEQFSNLSDIFPFIEKYTADRKFCKSLINFNTPDYLVYFLCIIRVKSENKKHLKINNLKVRNVELIFC